jgi:ubiquinone/menaquinone biosynthesis C-methylase UbiE
VLATFGAKPEYLQMLIFDLEHYLRFYSIKDARKRGSSVVDVADVDDTVRHLGKPERFMRSEFKDAATLDTVQSARLALYDSMKKSIEESQNPRVLDAGCGWGRWIVKLHSYCRKDFEMVGVDLDDFSLEYALGLDRLLNVARSDVERLPFRNDVFDLIFCSAVIHEVKTYAGRENTIREFHRVLRPAGMLYIIDAFSTNAALSMTLRLLRHAVSRVEWMFELAKLERMLEANDFAVVSLQKMRYRLFGAIEVALVLSRKR